ncbi:flippase-like domain-containing protein [bacterium]|nr:flippase-like domain-containing protein [bacterium]
MKYKKTIQLSITLLMFYFIYRTFGVSIQSIIEEVKNISDPKWLLFTIFIPSLIIPAISINRWGFFLRSIGIYEKPLTLVKINFLSIFYGLVLPSSTGFDAVRMYLIEKRNPDKRGKAGSTIIIERYFGFVILSLIGIWGIVSIRDLLTQQQFFYMFLAMLLILIILIFLGFVISNQYIFNLTNNLLSKSKYLNRIFSYLISLHDALRTFPVKKVLLSSIVLITMFQLVTILNVFFIFKSFNIDIPLINHLAMIPIINIISIIPLSISGFGIREGAFTYFYSLVGIDPTVALIISLMNYIILMGIPALIGGGINVYDLIFKRKNEKKQS